MAIIRLSGESAGRGASSGDSVHTPTSDQTGALLGERTEAPLGRGQVTNAITGPRSPGHHQLIRTLPTKNKSRPGLSHYLIVVLIPQYDGYDNMIPVSRVSELLAAMQCHVPRSRDCVSQF